ncbi:MAG: TolC family protein, partial [Gammaproteobacteria bacterium]|nr:TolC family protein [Gammaproteobacteria bacterium]
MRIPRVGLLIAVGVLTACALSTPPESARILADALPPETTVPGTWRAEATTGAVTDDWLRGFDDPTLNALVAEALAHNRDLAQAAENV